MQLRIARLPQIGFAMAVASASMAQNPDTTRKARDTVRVADSLKKADTTTRTSTVAEYIKGAPKYVRFHQADPDIPEVSGPVRLGVDLSTRKLTIYSGDEPVKTFDVSVGMDGMPTPTGTFRISTIVWNPSWVPPNSAWARGRSAAGPGDPDNPMKVAKIMIHNPDYYIHGTANLRSLGAAESHGCIRMDEDEVASLAKFLMEHGGNAQDESWFSRVIHMRWKTHVVTLPDPIKLTVTQ